MKGASFPTVCQERKVAVTVVVIVVMVVVEVTVIAMERRKGGRWRTGRNGDRADLERAAKPAETRRDEMRDEARRALAEFIALPTRVPLILSTPGFQLATSAISRLHGDRILDLESCPLRSSSLPTFLPSFLPAFLSMRNGRRSRVVPGISGYFRYYPNVRSCYPTRGVYIPNN